MKHETMQQATKPSQADSGPEWAEEWIDPAQIIRLEALQVRSRLSTSAIRDYASRTRAGSLPPPIKVARLPEGRLLLIDGWHRLAAEAVEGLEGPQWDGQGFHSIRAEVAPMTEREAHWQAAAANMGHGVPLKPRERRKVLGAFIKAGKHRKGPGRGEVMSYRELAAATGIGHTTIRTWLKKDFYALFRAMGGAGGGNTEAEHQKPAWESLADQQTAEALEAVDSMRAGMHAWTPEARGALVKALEGTLEEARRLGTAEEAF